MKNLVSLLLILTSFTLQAQNIKGKVCYEKDKTPVQFAPVALIQLPDSTMITGVITLTDGGFNLENVKPGNYLVRASFLGYHPAGKAVSIGENQKEISLDTIFLAEAIAALNEVTVTGERLKGEELVDRTVYKIPEVVAKASSNGYDVLKKIPQVNVDFQNNVTLNGSSNFIIQVDGRQRDKEFLARLLPSDIQSVEIISNPSGKYEGNIDGVISIKLRKEARYGMSGNTSLNLKPFNKVTAVGMGSLDYSAGKITFYATVLAIHQQLNMSTMGENRFSAIDSLASSITKGKINVTMPSVNTGFDYYINDRNNMSFNVSYKPVFQKVDLPGSTLLSKSGNPLEEVSALTSQALHSNETSASLFYKRAFQKPVQELTSEISYYNFRSTQQNDFTNETHPYNGENILSTYSRFEDDLNKRDYLSAKFDFVYPLGLKSKIETGYQMYYQQMGYDFNINNSEGTNLFEYSELRNSGYAGLNFSFKKFGFQTLLRVENSRIMADSVSDRNYSCFLPSANIQYKFSASQNLKLTYNRRINRPGIYDMNPYEKISQDYAITRGNPNLRPDYRDRIQLTHTWNFGSNYLSPYIYDEFFSDKTGNRFSIIRSPLDGSITTISRPYNLLNGYEAGGGLNAMLWYVNLNARVFKGHYNGYSESSFSIPARDYSSFAITGYAFKNLDKKKKTTAFLYFAYNGINVNAQSKTFNKPLYGTGFQYQIKDHTLGLFWLLPLASHNVKFQRIETEAPGFSSRTVVGIDFANWLQFSYSYRFNKGKSVKKLDHKVEVESDSKGQTIGR
ncbi:MAG TPA: outer membrane beta-barrel family protein [Bacteroidales bacterium]|nr:outer membrane beta-barrel family protein [Bacteroidales bacterium]